MTNKIENIKNSESPEEEIAELLLRIHDVGPEDQRTLEELTYYKVFHTKAFLLFEEELIVSLGLFYKVTAPSSLYSFLMAGFGETSKNMFGKKLTPVQASIRAAIESSKYISISAPTSSGKSYSIREYLFDEGRDVVIIVPSRALIAEYIKAVKDSFSGNKNVMVMPFADYVFSSRDMRRVYVLTPERASDLFKIKDRLHVSAFFFDEAQISEEKSRGVIFDLTLRRIIAEFPGSKLIFAHPFVENPEAQFKKHSLVESEGFHKSYKQGTVGKIFVHKHPSNGKDYYFSPFEENGHRITECLEFGEGFGDFALSQGMAVLVYVSKASLYNGRFVKGFSNHIHGLPEVSEPYALEIIDRISDAIGANNIDHFSKMVSLLKKGVVIHHGSIPLEVRLLIEEFIRHGFSSLCFATSTLAQGVNMPFDIVWLDSNRFLGDEKEQSLAFKNLIGRSGRLSAESKFDFGYVYTNNAILFSKKIKEHYFLDDQSIIGSADFSNDSYIGTPLEDEKEVIESVRDGSFLTDYDMPAVKFERLSSPEAKEHIETILENIFNGGSLSDSLSGDNNYEKRRMLRSLFANLYELYLGRPLLRGEAGVFRTAFFIFFLLITGKTFKEIVAIRYRDVISPRRSRFAVGFIQPADKLPNIYLTNEFSIFSKDTNAKNISYDRIVFDTYEYLDRVISFSLSDVFVAAFDSFYRSTGDARSESMANFFKYGTNDKKAILLLRYGFSSDEIKEIDKYVETVSENTISFNREIDKAPADIRERVDWYLS